MTEHKFTDEQIIKALECCLLSNDHQCEDCEKCPLYETYDMVCQNLLAYHALDLINRQKAEIERLRYEAKIDESEIKCTRIHRDMARAEAIKEFAEKAKRRLPIVSPNIFDQIVKELTEE